MIGIYIKNLLIFLTCMVIFTLNLNLFAAQMDEGKLIIYTVNYPLQFFDQRIAGRNAEVVFPAPADVDPAFWSPDVQTIKAYQEADLILLNGASYAKWIQKVTLPQFRMVNASHIFKND